MTLAIALWAGAAVLATGLFAWACARVRKHRFRNRVLWTLNRIRASLAHEGDPGPWYRRHL